MLPDPVGAHAVGRKTFFLTDSGRYEPATPEPRDRREVIIHIWYPQRREAGRGSAPYMPELEKYRDVVSASDFARWLRLRAPVTENGEPAKGPFPVVLFSHGWSSRAASYSTWIMDLASHGFVVVGVDHPYRGVVATSLPKAVRANDTYFPNQKYANLFYPDDLTFVAQELERINREDAAMRRIMQLDAMAGAGHSSGFGSAVSAYAALQPRLRALISFDAGPSSQARELGLQAPLLLVRADSPTYTDILVRRAATHASSATTPLLS